VETDRISMGPGAWMAALVSVFVLTTAPVATAREAGEDRSRDRAPESLMENEFSAIDLFEKVQKLRPRFRLSQEATVDQNVSGADIDTYMTALRAQVVAPLSKRLAVRLVGRGRINAYDFDGDRQFLATGNQSGDPFDELLSTSVRFEGRYQAFDSWALVGGATYRSSWERGAAYDSGVQGGGFAGVGYLFGKRFSVIAGVSLSSRLGRSGVSWRPLFKIGWKLTDTLEIESEGLGGKIAYRPIKPLTLFIRGALDSDRYRLKRRDGPVGRGTVRDRKAPVVVGWSWKITRNWRFRGHLGAVVYQQLRVSNKNGDSVDTETSRSPAFTARLQIEFRI
jgi:hypothetical protein